MPERNQRAFFEDPTFQTWIDSLACVLCGGGDNEDQLMLCDGEGGGPVASPHVFLGRARSGR